MDENTPGPQDLEQGLLPMVSYTLSHDVILGCMVELGVGSGILLGA